MKNTRKTRLQHQALQDPSVISRLVATETVSVYNAKGIWLRPYPGPASSPDQHTHGVR